VVDAIRLVAGGGSLFTPRTISALISKRREVETQLERLTPREKEVLRLMAEGVASREIAKKLGISYTTVRTHIRSLGSKLGVHSKLEAIVKARELAWSNSALSCVKRESLAPSPVSPAGGVGPLTSLPLRGEDKEQA